MSAAHTVAVIEPVKTAALHVSPNKQETRGDHEDWKEVMASISERRVSLRSEPVGGSKAFN